MARKRKARKEGVTIHTGDSVVIPPGQIRLSLKREESTVRFSPAGARSFVQGLYFRDAPDTPANLDALLQAYRDEADSTLKNSSLLRDIDLNSEAGVSAALERLKAQNDSVEIWAFRILAMVSRVNAAVADNDTLTAVWAMNQLTNSRAMLIFRRELEELVWRGYQQSGVSDPATGQTHQ